MNDRHPHQKTGQDNPFSSDKTRAYINLLLITVICGFLLRPLWMPGFPQVTDGEYHLARIANYHLALSQGQFPPRWAPTFLSNLGNPVFNYNYPLFNLVASLFLSLGISVVVSLKLIITLSLLSAGLGMYWWLKQSMIPLASLIGAVVYIASPYMQLDIFVRGNIGEVVVMGLLPWVFLACNTLMVKDKPDIRPRLAVLLACLWLAHNITGVLASVMLIFILVTTFKIQRLIKLAVPVLIGMLLVSFFWIPALAELKYVQVSTSTLNTGFARHFMNLPHALLGPPINLTNKLHAVQTQLGIVFVAGVVIALTKVCTDVYKRHHDWTRFALPWLTVALVSVFLVTHQSDWLWKLVSPLRYVQHPSRFLLFATFASSVVVSWIVHTSKSKVILLIFPSLTLISVLSYGKPHSYIPYENSFFYQYPLSSSAAEEFNPVNYDPIPTIEVAGSDRNIPYIIATGSAKIDIDYWNGSKRAYTITADQPITMIERTLYFPGWETKIDRILVNNNADSQTHKGLINYQIPPGKHLVETVFTQNTPSRLLGNILSVVGLLISGYLTIVNFKSTSLWQR